MPAIPNVGADIAALALHALAEVMEKARVARLTRYQHILLRLGELIAYAECAGSLSRRAALLAEGQAERKGQPALRRDGAGSDQPDLCPRRRAQGGRRRVALGDRGRWRQRFRDTAGFEASLGLPAIHRAQSGLISDLDYIADVLYGRTAKRHGPGGVAFNDEFQNLRSLVMENTSYRAIAIVGAGAVLPDAANVAGFLGKREKRPLQHLRG